MGQLIRLEQARSYRAHRNKPIEPRFTGREICRILGISPATLKRYRKRGMPYEPWSSACYRYVLSDVLAWRDANV